MKIKITLFVMLVVIVSCSPVHSNNNSTLSPLPQSQTQIVTTQQNHLIPTVSAGQSSVAPTSIPASSQNLENNSSGRIYFLASNEKYVSSQTDLYSIKPDGSNLVNLTNTPDLEPSFDVYLKTGKVVYAQWVIPENRLIAINMDGSNKVALAKYTNDTIDQPVWSPDGMKIAYSKAILAESKIQLCVMVVANSTGTCLGDKSDSAIVEGALNIWSPDSSQIVFASYSRDRNHSEIWVARVGESTAQQITNSSKLSSINPHWSPINQQILFKGIETNADGIFQGDNLYLIDADGTQLTRLTQDGQEKPEFNWSPDGKKIIYINTDATARNSEVILYDMASQSMTTLAKGPGVYQFPIWSPDGKQIAFGIARITPNSAPNYADCDLFVANSDGQNVKKIDSYQCPGLSYTWSPDGQKIAFLENGDKTGKGLGIVNLDGSGQTDLPLKPSGALNHYFALKWAPQSTTILSDVPEPSPTPEILPTQLSTGTRVNAADQAAMVFIPQGEFLMGEDQNGLPGAFPIYLHGDEGPQHKVYLDDFWIYKDEVTNAMYQTCVKIGLCLVKHLVDSKTHPDYYDDPKYADFPVVYVNLKEAMKYCEWSGGRLPTEAEWEKTARGTDGRLFPWGNTKPDQSMANFASSDTAKVGSFPNDSSPYAVLDMAGNVEEWTSDIYDSHYYQNSPGKNPKGPETGNPSVVRGGMYRDTEYDIFYLQTFFRGGGQNPEDQNDYLGFRCAKDAK